VCLLKIYVEDGDGRRLIARDVAFVEISGGNIDLRDMGSRRLACIEGFRSIEIDALASRLVVKLT